MSLTHVHLLPSSPRHEDILPLETTTTRKLKGKKGNILHSLSMQEMRTREASERSKKACVKAEEREGCDSRSFLLSRLELVFVRAKTLHALLEKTPYFDAIVDTSSLPAFLLCFFRPILFAVILKS
jgi:hypothetical protein